MSPSRVPANFRRLDPVPVSVTRPSAMVPVSVPQTAVPAQTYPIAGLPWITSANEVGTATSSVTNVRWACVVTEPDRTARAAILEHDEAGSEALAPYGLHAAVPPTITGRTLGGELVLDAVDRHPAGHRVALDGGIVLGALYGPHVDQVTLRVPSTSVAMSAPSARYAPASPLLSVNSEMYASVPSTAPAHCSASFTRGFVGVEADA
jgi:hypothetical protein